MACKTKDGFLRGWSPPFKIILWAGFCEEMTTFLGSVSSERSTSFSIPGRMQEGYFLNGAHILCKTFTLAGFGREKSVSYRNSKGKISSLT
jgi:hypothetical protein